VKCLRCQQDNSSDADFYRKCGTPARRRRRDDRRKIVRHQTHELVRAISELGWLNGVRPRVAESGLGLIPMHAYSAPYEDLKLKAN
jgi:hypothetical protein